MNLSRGEKAARTKRMNKASEARREFDQAVSALAARLQVVDAVATFESSSAGYKLTDGGPNVSVRAVHELINRHEAIRDEIGLVRHSTPDEHAVIAKARQDAATLNRQRWLDYWRARIKGVSDSDLDAVIVELSQWGGAMGFDTPCPSQDPN